MSKKLDISLYIGVDVEFPYIQFKTGFLYGTEDKINNKEFSVQETNLMFAMGYSFGLKSDISLENAWKIASHLLTAQMEAK
jgi:hypothetical protein